MGGKSGHARFIELLAQFSASYVEPVWKAHSAGQLPLKRATDAVANALIKGHSEISASLDNLELVRSLVGLAPPRSRRKIDPGAYLRLQIGVYLQEVYILDQRLGSVSTSLCRYYRSPQTLERVKELLRDALGGVVLTRGSHVHQERYSDQQLEALAMLQLVAQFKENFESDAAFEYKFVRRQWVCTMGQNFEASKVLMDQWSELILPMVTRDGKIFLPPTGGRVPRDSGHRVR